MGGVNTNSPSPTARLATLSKLIETTFAAFLDPVPSRETCRNILDSAQVPRFKCNATAKRGGGPCYYSVSAVEKLLRSRLLPGTVSSIRRFRGVSRSGVRRAELAHSRGWRYDSADCPRDYIRRTPVCRRGER